MNFSNAPGIYHYISGNFNGSSTVDRLNSPYSSVWFNGVHSQGEFIVPGTNNYIARSEDGHNWMYYQVLPTDFRYFIADCGNGVIVGVPYTPFAAVQSIISYDNAVTWQLAGVLPPTNQTLGQPWIDVASDKNGVCIAAIADVSATARSTDNGLTWSFVNIGLSTLNRIVYGGGVWMAISSTTQYKVSVDNGLTWSQLYTFPVQLSNPVSLSGDSIIYAGDRFVYMAFDGTGAHSADGLTWTLFTGPYSGGSQYKVAHTDGITFVAWNNTSGTASNIAYWTTDYVVWNTGALPITGKWNFVIGGGNRFVAVAEMQYGVNNVAVIQ